VKITKKHLYVFVIYSLLFLSAMRKEGRYLLHAGMAIPYSPSIWVAAPIALGAIYWSWHHFNGNLFTFETKFPSPPKEFALTSNFWVYYAAKGYDATPLSQKGSTTKNIVLIKGFGIPKNFYALSKIEPPKERIKLYLRNKERAKKRIFIHMEFVKKHYLKCPYPQIAKKLCEP
jgi:hypothetical protein